MEMFQLPIGLEAYQELWTAHFLARRIKALADNSELGKLSEIFSKRKPTEIKAIFKSIKSKK